MATKKKRRNARPRFFRIFFTLVLIGLFVYFCYMFINQSFVLSQQEAQIRQMQEDYDKLDEAYSAMLNEMGDKSTLEYINNYMRSQFGMIQENETKVVVVENK